MDCGSFLLPRLFDFSKKRLDILEVPFYYIDNLYIGNLHKEVQDGN